MMALSTIRKSPSVTIVSGRVSNEEDRPDDGVEQPEDQRGDGQRHPRAVVKARDDLDHHEEREGVDEPAEE